MDPVVDQSAALLQRTARFQEVIEVVEVITPELSLLRAAPVDLPVREILRLVEERKFLRSGRIHRFY